MCAEPGRAARGRNLARARVGFEGLELEVISNCIDPVGRVDALVRVASGAFEHPKMQKGVRAKSSAALAGQDAGASDTYARSSEGPPRTSNTRARVVAYVCMRGSQSQVPPSLPW